VTPRRVIASRWLLAAVLLAGVITMLRPLPPGNWTESWFDGADKLFHVGFFALLWCLGSRAQLGSAALLGAGLLLLGAGIEAAQALFTTTRSASFDDLLANGAGLLLGMALLRAALRRKPQEHSG
jgi:VanZ family protein